MSVLLAVEGVSAKPFHPFPSPRRRLAEDESVGFRVIHPLVLESIKSRAGGSRQLQRTAFRALPDHPDNLVVPIHGIETDTLLNRGGDLLPSRPWPKPNPCQSVRIRGRIENQITQPLETLS